MGKLAHEIEYFATVSIEKFAGLLSARQADIFGTLLGGAGYHIVSSRRKIAFDNLKQAFNGKYSDEELDIICRKVFKGFGKTFIEASRIEKLKKNNIADIIVNGPIDLVKESVDHGKGTIFLSAHYGNFELLGLWSASLGYDCAYLIGPHSNKKFEKKIREKRKNLNVGVYQLPGEIKDIFKHLKQNKILSLLADQHASSGNIIMDFLGRPASMAKGPALFSIRTGAPILPAVLRRERYDRHVFESAPLIYPPNSGDEEKDIRYIISTYNSFFEEEIRKYPEQWLWTHRRWKV